MSSSSSSSSAYGADNRSSTPSQGNMVARSPTPTGANTVQGQTTHVHASSGVMILTQNVVATLNCGVKLELKDIATQTRNSEYNPQRFSAVVLRIRQPKTTALIFGSGKVVVTGAKSVSDAKLATRKFGAIIRKVGHQDAKSNPSDIRIQNIVCSCDCRFAIRLEALALNHGRHISFEPELFPGLIYRMINPKVVLLIFVSGKVVITGAKDQKHVYEAFHKIYPVLLEYKKIDPAANMVPSVGNQQSSSAVI